MPAHALLDLSPSYLILHHGPLADLLRYLIEHQGAESCQPIRARAFWMTHLCAISWGKGTSVLPGQCDAREVVLVRNARGSAGLEVIDEGRNELDE